MKSSVSLIDHSVREIITNNLDSKDAQIILDNMEQYMLQNNVVTAPPLVGDGQTKGDWRINLTMPDGQKQDIRPNDALSYVIIKEMLKSGPIRFALEMKRAQMVSVFRNRRSVSVYCKNEELARVGEFVVERVLPFAAFEFTWSALVYGSAFMEAVWETKTLAQLGLEGTKLYTVPKQLNLVPHETVRHIRRTNSGDFDGFIQMADYRLGTYFIVTTPNVQAQAPGDILVEAESALIIPYNGFSRNLWGESFLYPLYPLWFWYEIIIRALVRYSELMGDPPRLGKAPSKKKVKLSENSTELVAAIDYLLAIAVNLTKSNAVVIPSDKDEQGKDEWDLGYMIAPDRSQPFVQILEMFNSMILRAALTGDRTYSSVQGQGVPSAVGQIGAEATALHNEMVVSSWLHYLNTYWFNKISKYNLGEDGVPAWLEIQGLDPKEREFLIQIANIAGNSSTFQEFFYKVDWESLGKMSGLPMFNEEQADQLKQKLQEQDLQSQVEQTRTQNQLGVENQIETAKAQQKIAKENPQPEQQPSNLEVQLKLEELTSGKVPIFFTQEEMKHFVVEKETATPQNFFIPSKPYDKDLATALAVAYKYKTIQLFNPLHDAMGKFARKSGSAVAKVIGDKFRKSHEIPSTPTTGFMNDKEFIDSYQSVPAQLRPAIVTPAEYLTRKEGLGPRATRLALDVGTDAAVSLTVGSAVYTHGALLGGAATAAIGAALFGAVPTAAVVIGGLVVGAAAYSVAMQVYRHAKTNYVYSYLDRYAPKDNQHIGFVHDGDKETWKQHRAEFGKSTLSTIGFDVAVHAFGPYLGIPGSWSVINRLRELEDEQVNDSESFAVTLLPYATAMLMGQVNRITIPTDLEDYPGFVKENDESVMTTETVGDFIEAWLNETLPVKQIEFGDTSVKLNDTQLESVQLGNPNHDQLGRFASKQGQAAQLFGSLEGKRQVNIGTAQKLVNKRVQIVGKRFESGLVDGLQTKMCNDWTCVKKETGIEKNALGVYYNNKLVLTPHSLTYSTYDDKKFFNRVVDHETVHARKRSQGGGITFRTRDQMDLEEGCTEMLSMGMNKYPYNKSPYLKQMRAVAKAARNGAGNDKTKAWKIVSLMHYYNDTDRGVSAFKAYNKGKGTDQDIEWLMGSMPTKLELDEDEKEFEKSEKEIYDTVRKVQDDTFIGEPKPFTDEELQ